MAKDKTGTKTGSSGVAALDRSPSHLLHRALQLALDIYGQEMGDGALTQRQFAVLAAAADHEGATQTGLVRITGIDRSTLADMVARLIAKGLLARERSASDARANTVRLTDAGRAALAEAAPKVAEADARLLRLIAGGGRKDALLRLLKDLVRAAEPAEPKPVKAAKKGGEGKAEGKKKKKDKAPKRVAA